VPRRLLALAISRVLRALPGCADTVDIGETSYSGVLADDLDNNGLLDLVVTTMNGNVYGFQTSATYHPLKAWTSQVRRFRGGFPGTR
jgi:hypothetical protein